MLNRQHPLRSRQWLLALTVVGAAAGLVACGNEDDTRTAGQKLDDAVAEAGQKAERAGDRIAEGAAEVKQDIQQAAGGVANAVDDATITAKVNAELARDDQLSALKIDVDTENGRVALKGSAPTAQARERAESLAMSVEGVVSVDNQLTVHAG
jgi:hyperosmotically inducible protein